ncbi:hypothetical protein [Halanaerobium saccharolyticum]|uniref:hypothetical protein n=1 Tax=Halanaerobium saccharolyticum TaxID=43595 RepID=UPI001C655521
MSKLQEYYNGYLFHQDAESKVFNSDMVLYFFKYYLRQNKELDDLIDSNISSDYLDILPARSLTLTNEDSLKELSPKLSFILCNDSFGIRPSRPSRGCRMIRGQSISSSPIH